MAQGHQVHFWWVPSHQGIAGNERADAAARAAMEESRTTLGEYFVMRTMLQGAARQWYQGQVRSQERSTQGTILEPSKEVTVHTNFGLDAGDALQIHGCQGRIVFDRSLPHGGVPP